MATKVSDVLRHKGSHVITVAPDQTAASVVEVLTNNRIGAVPVADQSGRLIGIISERDIIRGLAQHSDAALALTADRLDARGYDLLAGRPDRRANGGDDKSSHPTPSGHRE